MRSALVIALLIALGGCSRFTPIKPPKFPEAPAELTEKLPGLIPLDPGTKRPKELLDNAAENYGICYQYLERSRAWENWYQEQKSLYEQHRK